jgi:hypothetical protein
MFKKVWYNDADNDFLQNKINYSEFKNAIVKVIVTCKNNPYWFDKFVENIEAMEPVQLQIVEDHLNLDLEENEQEIIDEAESTVDIFKRYINAYDSKGINKDKLEKKIVELYTEAMSLG